MSKDQKRQTLLQGFNTRNWTEAVFYNNSSANISPQLSETDRYIQSRPTPSEPLFICPPFPLVCCQFLFFGKRDRSNNNFTHKKCQTVQAHMHFMKTITGNSVAEPSTISLFSIDQPTPQVIQTRSYTFTNYLLGEKTVKRLESSM